MCYGRDYYRMIEEKTADEAKLQKQRRAGQIDKLLNEANKQADRVNDRPPTKVVSSAK
jgi:hypothetical protein